MSLINFLKPKHNSEKLWIMNAEKSNLQILLKEFLALIDDYQQLAGENNDDKFLQSLITDYAVIENYYKMSLKHNLSFEERNYIRISMKEIFKEVGKYSN